MEASYSVMETLHRRHIHDIYRLATTTRSFLALDQQHPPISPFHNQSKSEVDRFPGRGHLPQPGKHPTVQGIPEIPQPIPILTDTLEPPLALQNRLHQGRAVTVCTALINGETLCRDEELILYTITTTRLPGKFTY